MELKSVQRAFLRSQAQLIDPVVYVGKDGLTDSVVSALDMALAAHELVKVRFQNNKDEIVAISRELSNRTSSILIATTGFTSVYFRQDSSDPERKYRI